jgi:hypothetical protein
MNPRVIELASHHARNVNALKILWLDRDNERPAPVEVKVASVEGLARSGLPARLSRPRRGQNARKTAAPAPRQIALLNA